MFQNKSQGLSFVRIHAPWQVLSREAELLKIKMPTKKVNISHFLSTTFMIEAPGIRTIIKCIEAHGVTLFQKSEKMNCQAYFSHFQVFWDDLLFRAIFKMGFPKGFLKATEAAGGWTAFRRVMTEVSVKECFESWESRSCLDFCPRNSLKGEGSYGR